MTCDVNESLIGQKPKKWLHPVSIYIIYFYISILRGAKWLNHGVK